MPVSKAFDHEVRIHAASIIKQIILTLSNPMSIVREALSNSCALEVGARKVIVTDLTRTTDTAGPSKMMAVACHTWKVTTAKG